MKSQIVLISCKKFYIIFKIYKYFIMHKYRQEAVIKRCSLKEFSLQSRQNPWKISVKELPLSNFSEVTYLWITEKRPPLRQVKAEKLSFICAEKHTKILKKYLWRSSYFQRSLKNQNLVFLWTLDLFVDCLEKWKFAAKKGQ